MTYVNKLLEALDTLSPDTTEFTAAELKAAAESVNMPISELKEVKKSTKVKRNTYDMSALLANKVVEFPKQEKDTLKASVQSIVNEEVYIPEKDEYFVAWGNFKDIQTIMNSKLFYPAYFYGESGNGKTIMVEQACSKLGREYVRVQISPETDEDDLLGGFRLINGETVFAKGPVVKAMEAGAVLLIDEIDRGSSKIMCLQGVLEGKPIMIKKTGEIIKPAPGFTIFASGNTKGRGDEEGKFSSSTIIDEAFLERFDITLEQPYPSKAIELKIILSHMEKFNHVDKDIAENLVIWSDNIRKTYMDEALEDMITTRRLCHIVKTFSVFKDIKKSIELSINRFDEDTKEAFIDLWDKVIDPSKVTTTREDDEDDDQPF